jgi:hypothetical protein
MKTGKNDLVTYRSWTSSRRHRGDVRVGVYTWWVRIFMYVPTMSTYPRIVNTPVQTIGWLVTAWVKWLRKWSRGPKTEKMMKKKREKLGK